MRGWGLGTRLVKPVHVQLLSHGGSLKHAFAPTTPFQKFHHIHIRECHYHNILVYIPVYQGGGRIGSYCVLFILCSAPNVTITANSSSPVSEGSAVRIDCTASGDGVNRTVLRRNREEVTDGVTSATLTIPVFTVDQHAGTYDCLVPNPIGMALSQGLRLDTCESSSGRVWVIAVCYQLPHSLSPPPSHTLVLPSQQTVLDLVRNSTKCRFG